MSPTIQLETWNRFEPTTTAQAREKRRMPVASERSRASGILTDRARAAARSCDAGPGHDHRRDRHLVEQEDVVEAGGDAQGQERREEARSEPAGSARQPYRCRQHEREAREPDERTVLGEQPQPFVVGGVEDRVAVRDRELAIGSVALSEDRFVEEHPPSGRPRSKALLIGRDEDLAGRKRTAPADRLTAH